MAALFGGRVRLFEGRTVGKEPQGTALARLEAKGATRTSAGISFSRST